MRRQSEEDILNQFRLYLLRFEDGNDALRPDHGGLVPGLGAYGVVFLVLVQVVPPVPGPDVGVLVVVLGDVQLRRVRAGYAHRDHGLELEVLGDPLRPGFPPLLVARPLHLLKLGLLLRGGYLVLVNDGFTKMNG